MKLLRSNSDDNEYPAFKALSKAVKNSSEATIISAFYHVEFLMKLMGKVPTNARNEYKITMVFNGAYGRRLKGQIEELKKLRKRLRQARFGSVDIRLIRIPGGLFHTKLFMVQNRTQPQWFVGSSNATKQGFYVNDEILLNVTGRQNELRSYINDTLHKSKAINDPEFDPVPEDIIAFLRDGAIYFKSSAQVSFSYPMKLPDKVADKYAEQNQRPRYTDPALPFTTFNIRRAISADIDLDITHERKIVPIRSNSVETCFGYWVPTALTGLVNEKIDEKSVKDEKQLEALADEMVRTERRTRTIEQFGDFLGDIEQATNTRLEVQEMMDNFEKYYERLTSRLSNPVMRERYSRPLTVTSVPEIWDDPVASADFKDTFLQDVCTRLETGQRGIVKTIVNTINKPIEKLSNPNELGEHLNAAISKKGLKAFRWSHDTEDEIEG